ncbi:ribosome assembly cofactor RimP [Mangrovimonas sp. AS39]|uniref:ribosome assembly cofactor RimP n=1 Tax=Mangrovimonas futianensis TaxID=2895523 RepID=UPI001E4BB7B7|nr:ribosome assembly cofactor RimP [Mangrovimonas futianensis]MCF1189993.1 ribosome assembly cofactor RimP [Mangrovimonas futianensis]MCF1194256.1 ribosome assembly cofactor RimP [Mangrovimonas futianensis]
MLKPTVEKLLENFFDQNPQLFLIDMSISEDNKIMVVIDGDQGVTVEDCVNASRAVEHNLDREEEDFSFEVSSAGATAPLVNPRQYAKNIGRELAIKTNEDVQFEGKLAEANDENITIQWKVREPKPVGKGKVTVKKEAVIGLQDIKEAKVMIKF